MAIVMQRNSNYISEAKSVKSFVVNIDNDLAKI